ncbi:hypothetical protein HHI36_009204, partial [Cryptolaemus montrouzieri]
KRRNSRMKKAEATGTDANKFKHGMVPTTKNSHYGVKVVEISAHIATALFSKGLTTALKVMNVMEIIIEELVTEIA